jgi:UDP-glucose 4-epimerase
LLHGAEEWSLIHCAGYAHRPNETAEEVERFYAINAAGTEKIVDWCRLIGVSRILYISSIAFYDWEASEADTAVNEDAPLLGTTAYADSKLKGEVAVRDSGLDYGIVRLATVFGDGDRANFAKLAKALKRGKFILPGAGEARKSVISVNKAAEWIGTLALMQNPTHRLVNLGFSQSVSLKEVCQTFHEACGFPRPKTVPLACLRLAAIPGNLLARMKPNFPLTSTNLLKLTRSTHVDCRRAAAMIPEVGQVDFASELKKSAEYYSSSDIS